MVVPSAQASTFHLREKMVHEELISGMPRFSAHPVNRGA